MAVFTTISHKGYIFNRTLIVVIPVGKLEDLAWVDVGTAAIMIAMFFYLLTASIRTARRLSSRASSKAE